MSGFQNNPESFPAFPVTVIMERRTVVDNPWTDAAWKAIGVMIDSRRDSQIKRFERVVSDTDMEQYLWFGLHLSLYADEGESYYYNLKSEQPAVFVISRPGEALEFPEPFLVTASFDEANAYQESDEMVYSAPMAPEIYRWIEKFVLENYVPEKKIKRKRKA